MEEKLTEIRLKIFDSESLEKKEVIPSDGKKVRMYACGPTVYNFAHIGNLRTYVFEDLLKRTLEFFHMPVELVMNITDVDDKTIREARAKGVSLKEFTAPFTKAFFEDLSSLKIKKAEHYPHATDYIDEMIEMIKVLLEKGFAYIGEDKNIYFSIKKFLSYGRLSHLHLDELEQGASNRLDQDEYDKDNASDFGLWKAYDEKRDGDIYWDSPFGKGRPGWHLECSAMALKLLGSNIDLHCGGEDNIFPHHENEIAQSEAYTGERFVRQWVHSKHLLVNNKKMSKSTGNFYTLRDLLKEGYLPNQIRYLLMQTHYRTSLNFTFEGLKGAKTSIERIASLIQRLQSLNTSIEDKGLVDPTIEKAFSGFAKAMADDLNISSALSYLFDLIRDVNIYFEENRLSNQDAVKILNLLKKFDLILDIMEFDQPLEVASDVEKLLQDRQQARQEKNWSLADELRDKIISLGYEIEDSKQGPRVIRRKDD